MPQRIPNTDGMPNTAQPEAKLVAAKLPDGEPPYENPLDLRFPLHFAIRESTEWNELPPEVQMAANALGADGRIDEPIYLTRTYVGPNHLNKQRYTPLFILVTIWWEAKEPGSEGRDYDQIYSTAIEITEENFPKEKFGEKKYPWLYPPVVRFNLREIIEWGLLD